MTAIAPTVSYDMARRVASLEAMHGAVPDSVRMDQSPLPGGVATVFRFLFSGVPQWIQIGGVVLGTVLGLIVVWLAWKRRAALGAWLASRTRGYKLALGAGVGTTLLAAGLGGGWTYHYMMHENDFCSSCHVMSSAFGRFQKSEHSKLQCHSCHQQSIFASTKELYFWVMDRPEKIEAHAKVPNRICAECHITQKRDSVWQFISQTAGHQAHMKSDSASLKDLMCVNCHAREVHRFAPTDASCKQSGCHDQIKVKLGKMADQTSLHCATCHEFSRPMVDTASVDSARVGLVPLKPQCFYCHEMREKLEKAGLDKDPHKAQCGICHNAHKQDRADGAIKSCATAQCHASADTLTVFHRGLGDHAIDDCTQCHKSHTWKVKGKECLSCHSTIFEDRPARRGLLRKVTNAEAPVRGSGASATVRRRGGPSPADDGAYDSDGWSDVTRGEDAPFVAPPAMDQEKTTLQAQQLPRPGQGTAADSTFPHSRHKTLSCSACHDMQTGHATLTVRDKASCQGCHHAKERADQCTRCHEPRELATSRAARVTIHVSVRKIDSTRTLGFEHERHQKQACATCHAEGVSKTLVKQCTSCHRDHHDVERNCIACHPSPRVAHERVTHDGCARCHKDASAAAFPPTRSICLTCHRDQLSHFAQKDCVQCHRVSWNEVKIVEEVK
ncbi:MAG: hypothetical protein IT359_07305 [Gemmatimonadaceae bacterium]|nr:hypothetical protein [Gemmatimonadaceae bacterium]